MFSYYVHLVIAQSAPFVFVGLLQPTADFLIFMSVSLRNIVFHLLQMLMITARHIVQGNS